MYNYAIQYTAGTTEASSAETSCADGATTLIEPLYGSVTLNPDNEDYQQIIAECLVRKDVVDAGYTKSDFMRDLGTSADFLTENPVGADCIVNPKG
ncbi:hypothetical protein DCE94_05510 [Agromyces badenianii]|nr:hypothetical protein DCE94_05510 [Agromyces badenianii]